MTNKNVFNIVLQYSRSQSCHSQSYDRIFKYNLIEKNLVSIRLEVGTRNTFLK